MPRRQVAQGGDDTWIRVSRLEERAALVEGHTNVEHEIFSVDAILHLLGVHVIHGLGLICTPLCQHVAVNLACHDVLGPLLAAESTRVPELPASPGKLLAD